MHSAQALARKLQQMNLRRKDAAFHEVAAQSLSLPIRQHGMRMHKRLAVSDGYVPGTGGQFHRLFDRDLAVLMFDLIVVAKLCAAESSDGPEDAGLDPEIPGQLCDLCDHVHAMVKPDQQAATLSENPFVQFLETPIYKTIVLESS